VRLVGQIKQKMGNYEVKMASPNGAFVSFACLRYLFYLFWGSARRYDEIRKLYFAEGETKRCLSKWTK
jgi:hypothetical protein